MDISGKSKAELVDMLISLASSLKEEDLENPETFALTSQLVSILDPSADPLPQDIIDQVKNLNAKDQFTQAAMMTGSNTPEALDRLKESMKASGLLKAEDLEKIAFKDVKDSHILLFPVSIRGKRNEPGHADYHITLKWFGNKAKPDHEQIQNVVNRYQVHAPEGFKLKPDVWETKTGTHHVLKLEGHRKELEYAHHDLSEEVPSQFKYSPHITVSKEIHQQVLEGRLKPEDIKVHPLEYRIGDKHHKTYVPAPQATEHVPKIKMAKAEVMKEKFKKAVEWLKSTGKPEVADKLEKTVNELEKGQDEFGNPIRGRNKRYQQSKVFGKPSDVKPDGIPTGQASKIPKRDPETNKYILGHEKNPKTGKKEPILAAKPPTQPSLKTTYKIPDANGGRTSDQRHKMMNVAKKYAEKKYGAKVEVAAGKRDASGELKEKNRPIHEESFDVFSKQGVEAEKKRTKIIKDKNKKRPEGQKIKRLDPKPDWRSGKLETQPSPDAFVHEMAHIDTAPKGMGLGAHQEHMDKEWGASQSKFGHMQQKKTAGEIQPMAMENPLRREMGLPANRSTKPTDKAKPVAQAIDGSGSRFVRGKDHKGETVDYDRQARNLNPENKQRLNEVREGHIKYDAQKGWHENQSIDAKINRKAAQPKAAPKASTPVQAAPQPKTKKPEKLAANEMKGLSFNDLKKEEAKQDFAKQQLSSGLSYNDIRKK